MVKTDLSNFDPVKVGKLDADMWRAYYNHQFFLLFRLLVVLIKNQLGLSWLLTIRSAYYSAWAATDYRIHKKQGTNSTRVLRNLCKFYGLVSKHSVKSFDFHKAAELELVWWEVHRRSYKTSIALEQALAESAAVIYNVKPQKLKEYARYRAEAMILPRHKGDDQTNRTDWQYITDLTIKSWTALHEAVQN
ncbi:MAG: hypothetical protein JWM37_662 [Candidatus Saccharibacteria bacterium]|nr:hypothetical protein [Candidatus Saccharibacteria bacterium]